MGHNFLYLKQGKFPILYPNPLPSFLQSKKQKRLVTHPLRKHPQRLFGQKENKYKMSR